VGETADREARQARELGTEEEEEGEEEAQVHCRHTQWRPARSFAARPKGRQKSGRRARIEKLPRRHKRRAAPEVQ